MEVKEAFIEPLLQKAEEYGKTSLEILKLKALDKSATVTSSLISRLLFLVFFVFFFLILNIALSLWLGDMLGKSYYGFLIVALFYGIVAAALFFLHSSVKGKVGNFIITQMLK
jgi:hypothetical protein